MTETIGHLFSSEGFMPHGMCIAWTPRLLWTMVGSDLVIALSYYSIPAALLYATRHRRNQHMNIVLLMFAAFIFACGTTHLINILTVWYPKYWLDATAKVITATISAGTAVALWPIVGRAKSYLDEQDQAAAELAARNRDLAGTLEQLERQRADLAFLSQFSGLLDVAKDEDEISALVADAAGTVWPGARGALFVLDPESKCFELARSWGDGEKTRTLIAEDDCWAARLGRPFPPRGEEGARGCPRAGCCQTRRCIPIAGGGQTHAVIQLEHDSPDDARTALLVPTLSERIGLALHHLRLKQSLEFQSTRDPLTGLYNRRYMDEALRLEDLRAQRHGQPYAVILFDLDHFKSVNDTHGHEIGDAALKLFVGVLRQSLRSGDILCRYGGEEFVVVLPSTSTEQAEELADRVRENLEHASATSRNPKLRGLTVSGGVAGGSSTGGVELLVAADAALYSAKTAGRNRVVVG